MSGIAQNLCVVREQLRNAAQLAGRVPEDIRLLAVSKTKSIDAIREAHSAGQAAFGENYVQEAKSKILSLSAEERPNYEFHFIGHLQRNKVRDAVLLFDCIESVDRQSLAEEIAREAAKQGKKQRVFVQVNVSEEISKSGVSLSSVDSLVEYVSGLAELEFVGLMCIGSYVETEEPRERRVQEFVEMRKLRERLTSEYRLGPLELSMGMSHDFTLAIEEGATLVRVGTAIFGSRD